MSKRNHGQNHSNITFYNNLRKSNTISPHFDNKMNSIYIGDTITRKFYLPSIKKKPNQKISNQYIKLQKSRSQDNIYMPMDQTQFGSFNKQNSESDKILLGKIILAKMESKINDMNKNNKQLKKEREENLNIIKEIINSNNPPNKEIFLMKIQCLLDNKNKKTFDMNNLVSIKSNNEYKNNETKNKQFYEKIKINISPINALNEKNNYLKKVEEEKNKNNENKSNKKDYIIEEKMDNNNIMLNNINIIGEKNNNKEEKSVKVEEEKYVEKIEEENNEEKKNKKTELVLTKEGMIEEVKVQEDNNIINNIKNEEDNNKQENNNQNNINEDNIKKENINHSNNNQIISEEIKEDNIIKVNTISDNNTNINLNINLNKNSSFTTNNPINNNSKEEPINSKEIIEEEEKDYYNFNPKEQSAIFGKSFVYSQVFSKMKAKSELSQIKHQIINIQQKLRFKEDEIEDIKNRTTMKSLMYQSNVLNTKMIRLQKIKTKNQEFEYSSIPLIKTEKGNLINELDYYTKKHQSYICQNKEAEESYLKVKNEFNDNNKTFSKLELKSEHLKYKYNSLKLRNAKKQLDLDKLKSKVDQIESMKLMLENDKKIKDEKKKEIEETKKKLKEREKFLEKIKGNKDKNYQGMIKLEKVVKNKLGKQKKELNDIRNEIKDIDKKILLEIDKYHHLTKNNKTFINLRNIYQIKNKNEFIDFLKELKILKEKNDQEKRPKKFGKLLIGGISSYYKIALIENKPKKKEEILYPEQINFLEEKLEYFINSKGELELQKHENEIKKDEKKEHKIEENIINITDKKEEEKKEENLIKNEEQEKKEIEKKEEDKKEQEKIEDIKKEEDKKEVEKKIEDKNNENLKEEEKNNKKNIDEDIKEKEKKHKRHKKRKEKKDREIRDNDDKEKKDKKSKKRKIKNYDKESSVN